MRGALKIEKKILPVVAGFLLLAVSFPAQAYTNPLDTVQTFPSILANLANAIVALVLPILAAAIVWIGAQFLIHANNPSKLAETRKLFFWILLGGAIAIGAAVIAQSIVSLLGG